MLNGFIAACLHANRTVSLVLILLLVVGAVAYVTIPKEANPDINIPIVNVVMTLDGISPQDAERLLIRPMEIELRGIEGLKEMTAEAREGYANVTLEFDAGFDADAALDDVREKVDRAKTELPAETDEPIVSEVNFSLFPVITVALSGDLPERELVRIGRNLRDDIEGISSVLEVDKPGNREEAIDILIDPAMVESYELEQSQIFALVGGNNQLVAAGNLDTGSGRLPIKVPGLYEDPADILDTPIKIVGDTVIRMRDIALIRQTFKDRDSYSRVNGQPSITLEVKKRVGENIIETVNAVKDLVEQEQKNWPATLSVTFTGDQSRIIRTMLADLQNNVTSAILLVMIVVIAALGWRTGLLVGIAIPGSFLTGVLVLSVMGLTVNIVVLFALILAVGMLVDGAIVVTEFADRKMNEGLPRREAYLQASQRMAMPIIASTITTLAAFAPLLFWPGTVGEFMKYMPITLIATLSASLVMALIFVPVLGGLFGKPGPASGETMKSLAAAEGGDLTQIHGFTGFYTRMLSRAIQRPLIVLGLAVFSLIGVYAVYGIFGKGVEFFPDVEPELVQIYVRDRGDRSIDEFDQLVREVEDRILAMDQTEFRSVYVNTNAQGGGGGPMGSAPEDTHGIFILEFADWQDRRPGKDIIGEIRDRVSGIPGIDLDFNVTAGGQQAEVEIFALPDIPVAGLLGSLERINRAVDRFPEIDIEGYEMQFELPKTAAGDWVAEFEVFPKRKVEQDGEVVYEPPTRQELREQLASKLKDRNGFRYEFEYLEDGSLRIDLYSEEPVREFPVLIGQVQSAANTILANPHISSIHTISGTEVDEAETQRLSIAKARVRLSTEAESPRVNRIDDAIALFLEENSGVSGIRIEVQEEEEGPPVGKPVQVQLDSKFPELLEEAVMMVRAKFEETPGLIDIADTRPIPGVEWQVKVDREEAGRYGADIGSVGNMIQLVTNGLILGDYRPDDTDEEVDIRVRYPLGDRSLDNIQNLRIQTSAGLVPIGNFIEWSPAPKVQKVSRVDSRRAFSVGANVATGVNVAEKANEIQSWLEEEANLDERVNWEMKGEDEEQQESAQFLMSALLVALFVMGIILVTQFNNFYHAFLILTAVVFSTVGVFLGLLFTGQAFGIVMNGVGVISLAGIVVNNNIVLIDTFAHHRRNGASTFQSVLRTGAQRLRPVLLTTITTILGLVPMVMQLNIDIIGQDISHGAPSTQWWVQLATSVAFGLAFATILTLVVTPSLLMLGGRLFDGEKAEAVVRR